MSATATQEANKGQRMDEPVALPWRVVTLRDGSVNIFGGEDGTNFVCMLGHGEGARADARRIVEAVSAATVEGV